MIPKERTPRILHLAALKGKMGEWVYYATSMRILDIVERVGYADEMVHKERYDDWLQRELRTKRVSRITKYLVERQDRFFSSLVVSVYAGEPRWLDISLLDTEQLTVDELTGQELVTINRALGVLQLSGKEDLFALDGQHRLAGLREAIKESPGLGDEILSVLFVADRGKKHTRRMFTTLNRYAAKITPGERVILDEDDAMAIVTRRLIEEHPLLSMPRVVTSPKQASLSVKSESLTTPLHIYTASSILCIDFPGGRELGDGRTPWSKERLTDSARPPQPVLDAIYHLSAAFWTDVQRAIQSSTNPSASLTRSQGHLMSRPVGQMAFARAVRFIAEANAAQGLDAVSIAFDYLEQQLPKPLLQVDHPVWRGLLWKPATGTMINGVLQQKIAARMMCIYAGFGDPVTRGKSLLELYRKAVDANAASIPHP